jgi:hypothetical protein
MHNLFRVLILIGLPLSGFADETAQPEKPADGGGAPPPQEPKPFVMPPAEAKKLERLLRACFDPGRGGKVEAMADLERFVARPIGGRSLLEDVATLVDVANRLRAPNVKLARFKGKFTTVEVKPAEHGFPGGIGTVRYHLYVPKQYTPDGLAPLLVCLPDNRAWDNGAEYAKRTWVDRVPEVAERYVVLVPEPNSKGEPWTSAKSMARAMISIRHACGTFEPATKGTCAAVDLRRVVLDGADAAALVAARHRELFCGVVLHGADGRTEGGPDLVRLGGVGGLPAYCVVDGKQAQQVAFANKLAADNALSVVETAGGEDARLFGDAAKIAEWVAKLPREDQPRELDWFVYDGSFQRCYWINVLEFDSAAQPAPGFVAKADRAANSVTVETNGVERFELWLNDAIVDLNRDVAIVVRDAGKDLPFYSGRVERKVTVLVSELEESNHPWRVYTARFVVDLPALRAQHARRAQEEAAKAAKAEAGKN